MLFSIQHKTELSYSHRITESVMEVRLTPRSDAQQSRRHFDLGVSPAAPVSSHVDWQGNTVHQFSIAAVHDRIVIGSHAVVETHPVTVDLAQVTDPVRAARSSHRLLDFLSFAGPVQRDPRILALAESMDLYGCTRAMDVVRTVTEATPRALTYQRGVTSSLTTVREALEHGVGVCQDFAHLGLALLRLVGIPCRYVSGYLHSPDAPEVETHAWCEAFLPSAGWVGFDPTHGEIVGERHVAVATGRSYADVPPNRGVYRGEADEKIAVVVTILQLQEQPRIAPFAVPFAVQGQGAADGPRRRMSGYELEQQQQQQQQQ